MSEDFGANYRDEMVKKIGRRIALLREQRRISLEELAFGIGISQQQLFKCEIGQDRITADQLVRVAETLNLKMIHFFPIEDVGEKVGMPPLDIKKDCEILEHLAQFRKFSGDELTDKFLQLVMSETKN